MLIAKEFSHIRYTTGSADILAKRITDKKIDYRGAANN
jgi:hypothetical protein